MIDADLVVTLPDPCPTKSQLPMAAARAATTIAPIQRAERRRPDVTVAVEGWVRGVELIERERRSLAQGYR